MFGAAVPETVCDPAMRPVVITGGTGSGVFVGTEVWVGVADRVGLGLVVAV